MRELIQILKENKVIIIVIVALFLVFLGWSVMKYLTNNNHIISQTLDKSKISSDEIDSIEKVEEIKLNSDQKKTINDYSTDIKDFIKLLETSIWVSDIDDTSVRFENNASICTKNGKSEVRPFIVQALIPSKIIGDGAIYTGYIVAVNDGSKFAIVKIERWQTDGQTADKWKLSSTLFGEQMTFSQAQIAYEIEIKNLNDTIGEMYGGKEELEQFVKDYCTNAYPTAKVATWQEKAEIDWKKQIIKTTFVLDDKSSSIITVIFRMDPKMIEIGGVF